MEHEFTLITGRTRNQAKGLHEGAGSPAHIKATSYVEIGPEDMNLLDIEEGQEVHLISPTGQVTVPVKSGNLPSGILFIPMGPTANTLVETETYGTGMPAFKGQRVTLKRL